MHLPKWVYRFGKLLTVTFIFVLAQQQPRLDWRFDTFTTYGVYIPFSQYGWRLVGLVWLKCFFLLGSHPARLIATGGFGWKRLINAYLHAYLLPFHHNHIFTCNILSNITPSESILFADHNGTSIFPSIRLSCAKLWSSEYDWYKSLFWSYWRGSHLVCIVIWWVMTGMSRLVWWERG